MIFAFLMAFFIPVLLFPLELAAGVFLLATLTDAFQLFFTGNLSLSRGCADRFSNGDDNEVEVLVNSSFTGVVHLEILDEVPVQFQWRDFSVKFQLEAGKSKTIKYQLRPVERGQYTFGNINALVDGKIGLIRRKIVQKATFEVKVYPSFIKLHQYELLAISQNLTLQGEKKVRKVGNSREFDTIKDYVLGDDPRKINWSATARRGHLMTNHFIDERAQNMYCVIDKSRTMKMPFEGMTLLDYAVNSSLVISNVALKKGDLAGLITFENKVGVFKKAGHTGAQLYQLMESLYQVETSFQEPDFSALHSFVIRNINQRSLLLFFTNFESVHSLHRQLPFLKLLSRKHLVLVIYFRNTEVDRMLEAKAATTRQIYDQSIARQMLDEKYLIRDELSKAGILSLYTTPKNLNVDVINKYVEIKARRIL